MKPSLVLVPGLASDDACWKHQTENLQEIAEVTVADLSACTSRAEMADAILKAAPERFALAGNSMGGWAAQEVAAKAPARVTKLALIGTWARPDPDFNKFQREVIKQIKEGHFEEVCAEHIPKVLHPDRKTDKALVDVLKGMMKRAGPEVTARQIQAMVDDYDSRACLTAITCPTLIIAGRQDAFFSLEEHKFLAAQIAGARMAIIEDCGHAVQMERPHAVTALLRYWLTYF